MSVPSATSDGQHILSSYSTPLDKPKPFVVYKPGYLEKIKQNQASFQPGSPQLMFSHSPLMNQAPIQQITQPMMKTATLGQAKLQIEKNGHGLNNLVPISDFESNEITSRQLQSLIRGVSGGSGDDERFPIPHQIVEPSHLTPARPITINKQLTLDTLAQQRGQLLSSQLRQPTPAAQPMMIYGTQQTHQTLPVRQTQVYQQPKMFARQIEQPQMQFAPMLSHHQKPQLSQQHEQSARMRLIDQEGSSIQIPQPQLSSSIQMPESNQKIDPKRELQEQINFVLQNSPNLSENSRGKHRNEVIRAVQESMSELDSSNGQRSNHGQYGSVDSLVPSSYASHQYRSESNEGQRQPKLAILDNTNSQYKPQQLMSTSQFAPESSAYSRYNQESTMFLPSPGQPQSNLNLIPQSKVQGTTSDTASNAALQSQYKTNLHQEIQRYLQEQMQKSTGTPVNFVSGSGGSMYTLSNQHNPMMKYNQQSSEIVEKVLSEQSQHPHSMLLNAPGQQVESAEKPNHFMLARQTELIQSQSSQQSTSTVNAPSDSKPSTTNVASSSSSSKSMNLESQLANSATSSANIQPESAKTLRGYNQWWKETAVANIQPMVPIYGTFYQQQTYV
ncbi:hypothetical protein BLOT_008764 [Blomia tropicalis]|nr:hypothetical protein BLOT_008764 [Blomia tropicalis]